MKNSGFTFIEVMVVCAIVAILSAIALPAYSQYVLKGRRIDAKTALAALQLAEEKYRGNNLAYTTDLTALGLSTVSGSTTSPQGYYTVTVQSADGVSYSAQATVNSATPQANDSAACPALLVTQTGFDTNTVNHSTCWGF